MSKVGSVFSDSEPRPLSIGARRMLLQDAIKQMRREIDIARKALSTAEKTLIYIEAQWNDDTLRRTRKVNAERSAGTSSRGLRDRID